MGDGVILLFGMNGVVGYFGFNGCGVDGVLLDLEY